MLVQTHLKSSRKTKALCDAADELKKHSGVKATGRELTKPVYAFTINWHEADNPGAAHMRETAFDALRALGMENCQAVIVEHTDRPHKHVHVIVNLVNPQTGQAAPLSNDAHKLDRWADDYEVTQGVIRSPDRQSFMPSTMASSRRNDRPRRSPERTGKPPGRSTAKKQNSAPPKPKPLTPPYRQSEGSAEQRV